MKDKWKKFERVVAAIHKAETAGATVTWDEDIDGRQFDVVVRFKMQFYDYLVLIECKDYKSKVKAEQVDAFVTKSSDAGANKAIMVSASGFQEGARRVARKHKIELFTLKAINDDAEDQLTDLVISSLVIRPFGFRKTNTKEVIRLTDDVNKVSYEMNNTKLANYGGQSIGDLMRTYSQLLVPYEIPGVPKFGGDFRTATDKPQQGSLTLMVGTKATFPLSEEEVPVSHFLFWYWMEDARLMKQTIPLDPTIFTDPGLKYDYTNELTGESTRINPDELPLGFDTIFKPGVFYTQPGLKFSYLCESVSETEANISLVESYQHGILWQAEAVAPLSASVHYVEVTDEEEIVRLRELYDKTLMKRKKSPA